MLWTAASVADASAVNPNGIKTLSASGLSIFFIKGNLVSSNGSKSLPKDPPDYPILCNWVFDNFILADDLFAEALQSFETYVLVNNTIYVEYYSHHYNHQQHFEVTSTPFFIPNFNLLSCELDNFTFKVLYWVILYWYYIKTK